VHGRTIDRCSARSSASFSSFSSFFFIKY
jgi:hypothetical protein